MDTRRHIQAELTDTKRLADLAANHALMGPLFRSKVAELEQELATQPTVDHPRTYLFFTGAPVEGTYGIDANFLTSALHPYLEMVKTQYAATKHGSVGQRGVRRDEAEAKLLITGMPRGSVGVELSHAGADDLFAGRHLKTVLEKIQDVIVSAGQSDDDFVDSLDDVPSRVIDRLKDFFRELANHGAALRLRTGGTETQLTTHEVIRANRLLDASNTDERTVQIEGVNRGITLDSRCFDFRRRDDDTLVSGRIHESLDDDQIREMARMFERECVATFDLTTTTLASGASRTRYVLKGLEAM